MRLPVLMTALTLCGGATTADAQTVVSLFPNDNPDPEYANCNDNFPTESDPQGVFLSGPLTDSVQYGYGPGSNTETPDAIYKFVPPLPGGKYWNQCVLGGPGLAVSIVQGPARTYFVADQYGGDFIGSDSYGNYAGTILMLAPPFSVQTVLHQFAFGLATPTADGDGPTSLTRSTTGTLFGATSEGGPNGGGTVFRLTAPAAGGTPWDEAVLHAFGGAEGGIPVISFIGPDGALYGTTEPSPTGPVAASIWRLAPPARGTGAQWSLTVLHRFTEDAGGSLSKLVHGWNGSITGTLGATHGGPTMFQLTPPTGASTAWSYRIAYRFPIPATARATVSYVASDGTVYAASNHYASPCIGASCGRAWQLKPTPGSVSGWTASALFDYPDAASPFQSDPLATITVGFVRDATGVSLFARTYMDPYARYLIRISEQGWN